MGCFQQLFLVYDYKTTPINERRSFTEALRYATIANLATLLGEDPLEYGDQRKVEFYPIGNPNRVQVHSVYQTDRGSCNFDIDAKGNSVGIVAAALYLTKIHKLWKTVKENCIHKSYNTHIYCNDVIDPQGNSFKYTYAKIKRGVAVIAVDDEQNLLFLKEYRYPIRSWHFEMIGGGIEEGQDALTAAKNELQEEAGIIAKTLIPLGTTTIMPGNIDAITTGYLATDLSFTQTNREATELQELQKMPLKDAVEKAISGEFDNAEFVSFILRAARKLEVI